MALSEGSEMLSAWFAPDFDQGNLKENDLSVLAYRDGLVFILTHHKKGNSLQAAIRIANTGLVMQHSDITGLRIRLEKSGLPQGRYRKVCLYLRSDRYTVIPAEFLQELNPQNVLETRFIPGNAEEVIGCELHGLYSAFVDRPALKKLLAEYAKETHVYSYGLMVALESLRLSGGRKNIMLADMGSRSLDIALAGPEGLHFINSFPARTAEDAAYHFINVYRNQKEEYKVFLTGNLNEKGRATGIISGFVDKVSFLRSDQLKVPPDIPGGSSDLFLLLNQLRCGS